MQAQDLKVGVDHGNQSPGLTENGGGSLAVGRFFRIAHQEFCKSLDRDQGRPQLMSYETEGLRTGQISFLARADVFQKQHDCTRLSLGNLGKASGANPPQTVIERGFLFQPQAGLYGRPRKLMPTSHQVCKCGQIDDRFYVLLLTELMPTGVVEDQPAVKRKDC